MLLRRKLQCTFILRVTTAQSTTVLARVPYVVFDLKPLNEDGYLKVCMYCMHARKGASEALRTHFRACKISKFSGRVPPDPPHTIYIMGPLFVFALGPSHLLGGPAG